MWFITNLHNTRKVEPLRTNSLLIFNNFVRVYDYFGLVIILDTTSHIWLTPT